MKTLASILIAAVLCGCASVSSDLNKISLGMTKQQVIQQLGQPHARSADKNVEYLTYFMDRENAGGKDQYFVKLERGLVVSFGRAGDFDSTVRPKERLEVTYH